MFSSLEYEEVQDLGVSLELRIASGLFLLLLSFRPLANGFVHERWPGRRPRHNQGLEA